LKRRAQGWIFLVALAVLLVAASAAPARAGQVQPWAVLIGPGFDRYLPGTDVWSIGLAVVGDGAGTDVPVLAAASVSLDGDSLPAAAVVLRDKPWAMAAGRVSLSELTWLKSRASAALAGRAPDQSELLGLERVGRRLAAVLREAEGMCLTVTGRSSIAGGAHRLAVTLDYQVGRTKVSVTEEVQVLVASVPDAPGWYPADLHMHSTYSDGNKSIGGLKSDLASRGYAIGYVTEHTSALMSSGVFDSMSDSYPADCKAASDLGTSMFPGAEMAVGHGTWLGWNGDGHSLAYGISSTAGLNDNTWGPQTGLDKVRSNNSPLSSPGIAHPTHFWYPWEDWTVLRYYGIELMSGYQWYFDVNSGPATRWRSECARLQAYSDSFRPSVRSGSDYHSSWYPYVTHVKLPSDDAWTEGTWEDRWVAVSAALRDGRTTISRKGSLAYVTADGYDVGSSLVRAVGQTISFYIHFRPIEAGSYTLTLYRDNCASTVWTRSISAAANSTYTWTHSYSYPGSSHYYWLYVSGPDYCYTTPIYMHP